jgi:hypothetical protein
MLEIIVVVVDVLENFVDEVDVLEISGGVDVVEFCFFRVRSAQESICWEIDIFRF